MTRDTTLRATRRKLEELGYCVTSANHPSRVDDSHYSRAGQRLSLVQMADHPAAILTWPTPFHAPEFADEPRVALVRGFVVLIVTSYLLADTRQSKAVMAVLERHNLTRGPYRVDNFGNYEYPLRWDARQPFEQTRRARQTHPDDDWTVIFQQQVIAPHLPGYLVRSEMYEDGTNILEVGGEWRQGHILNTPRHDLPELLEDDVTSIIKDVERARWGARPAATSKEAA